MEGRLVRSRAILSLGGNIGDTAEIFRYALEYMQSNMIVDVDGVSSLYRSRSLLKDDQRDYLNIALIGRTTLNPDQLLIALKELEVHCGRKPSERWHERLIDIDIIDVDNMIYQSPALSLPHPQMQSRSFVLRPMMDIVPDYRHLTTGATLKEMYEALDDVLDIEDMGNFDF